MSGYSDHVSWKKFKNRLLTPTHRRRRRRRLPLLARTSIVLAVGLCVCVRACVCTGQRKLTHGTAAASGAVLDTFIVKNAGKEENVDHDGEQEAIEKTWNCQVLFDCLQCFRTHTRHFCRFVRRCVSERRISRYAQFPSRPSYFRLPFWNKKWKIVTLFSKGPLANQLNWFGLHKKLFLFAQLIHVACLCVSAWAVFFRFTFHWRPYLQMRYICIRLILHRCIFPSLSLSLSAVCSSLNTKYISHVFWLRLYPKPFSRFFLTLLLSSAIFFEISILFPFIEQTFAADLWIQPFGFFFVEQRHRADEPFFRKWTTLACKKWFSAGFCSRFGFKICSGTVFQLKSFKSIDYETLRLVWTVVHQSQIPLSCLGGRESGWIQRTFSFRSSRVQMARKAHPSWKCLAERLEKTTWHLFTFLSCFFAFSFTPPSSHRFFFVRVKPFSQLMAFFLLWKARFSTACTQGIQPPTHLASPSFPKEVSKSFPTLLLRLLLVCLAFRNSFHLQREIFRSPVVVCGRQRLLLLCFRLFVQTKWAHFFHSFRPTDAVLYFICKRRRLLFPCLFSFHLWTFSPFFRHFPVVGFKLILKKQFQFAKPRLAFRAFFFVWFWIHCFVGFHCDLPSWSLALWTPNAMEKRREKTKICLKGFKMRCKPNRHHNSSRSWDPNDFSSSRCALEKLTSLLFSLSNEPTTCASHTHSLPHIDRKKSNFSTLLDVHRWTRYDFFGRFHLFRSSFSCSTWKMSSDFFPRLRPFLIVSAFCVRFSSPGRLFFFFAVFLRHHFHCEHTPHTLKPNLTLHPHTQCKKTSDHLSDFRLPARSLQVFPCFSISFLFTQENQVQDVQERVWELSGKTVLRQRREKVSKASSDLTRPEMPEAIRSTGAGSGLGITVGVG